MEKSGSRSAHIKIIDQASLKSPWRYLFEGSLTLVFWALWIYWLLPVFTAVLWFFGIRLFYQEIFPQGGLEEFLTLLRDAGIVFVAIIALIFIWTHYNYLWFLRRGERRNKFVPICHDTDLARFFRVDPEALEQAKGASRIEVNLEKEKLVFRRIPEA
jgi:poly-beta-1,6-N-acetyl-D-glucosamine biosynthesis protein PgaD